MENRRTKQLFIILSGIAITSIFAGFTGALKNEDETFYLWGKWKVTLTAIACISSSSAYLIGKRVVEFEEFEWGISQLKAEGRRELKSKETKHRLAFAQKAQQLGFLEELAAFQEEFELLDQGEIDEEYDEIGVGETVDFRELFPEELDTTSLKLLRKGIGEGMNRGEIVTELLGCGVGQQETGLVYYDHLLTKL